MPVWQIIVINTLVLMNNFCIWDLFGACDKDADRGKCSVNLFRGNNISMFRFLVCAMPCTGSTAYHVLFEHAI
jgi:hypothetical protein